MKSAARPNGRLAYHTDVSPAMGPAPEHQPKDTAAAFTGVLAMMGFGEAAMAFVHGWGTDRPFRISAFDIKTDETDPAVRQEKWADYARHDVRGADSAGVAVDGADAVFSLVTADRALEAAESAAPHLGGGAFYLDCNSCAPGTKKAAAALIERAGGRYVDIAVMAPVHPRLHRTPLLVSGAHAADVLGLLARLQMDATIVTGEVGAASSIKMIRSIMVKGLEALTVECVLSAVKAGVDEVVLRSLEDSFPGFGWPKRAGYMLERVATHGVRRASEMHEVAATVDELGLGGIMSRAAAERQQEIGALKLCITGDGADYRTLAKAILTHLAPAPPAREISKGSGL